MEEATIVNFLDIWRYNMQGQVYVKVEADATTPMLMSLDGSSGKFTSDYVIEWKKSGGVTGMHGWPNGYEPSGASSTEEINAQIKNRWEKELSGEEKGELFQLWLTTGCAHFL